MPADELAPWIQSYAPTGAYDEMLHGEHGFRPAWKLLADRLGKWNNSALNRRAEQAQRLLREGGVTYGVANAGLGAERDWELDPIPLVFSADEWSLLAQGLSQRAQLLDLIAADLYGPQALLKNGVIPPEAVFGNPAYLPACHGINPTKNWFVHLCGFHLARNTDGQWTVLADRTQGPSGMGYCLENRIVASRVLSDEFHGLHVERLAGFFSQFREMLWSLSPRPASDPRVVLLSPGPRSATYFEDAYLARYLGFTLVEGDDLTVRNTQVLLKTLAGLQPVDVIWRRLADEDCDPLELRSNSWLGVTGLLQAVRSGAVSVANSLGTGWLEAPLLMSFLPNIARFFLQQDLKLPSLPTWWCGDPDSLAAMAARFQECVIRSANFTRDSSPIVVAELSESQRSELLAKIHAAPEQFVAQTQLSRATAPVWVNGRLEPWHVGLRAFVTKTPAGHLVMPGGLSRLAPVSFKLGESTSTGDASKDVWIISDSPVVPVTLLKSDNAGMELRRTGYDVPSRVIENIYWLSRFVERSENIVRKIRGVLSRLSLELDFDEQPELRRVVAGFADASGEILSHELPPNTSILSECARFVYDSQVRGSLSETLFAARRSANAVRDRLSLDAWRILNQLIPLPAGTNSEPTASDLLSTLHQAMNPLLALGGLANENLTRGPVWRFWEMGRRLERAKNMINLVRSAMISTGPEVGPTLELLLEIADSSMTYRQRYFSLLQAPAALDLLILDETNPRSVAFQMRVLNKHFSRVGDHTQPASVQREQTLLADAIRTVRLADADGLAEVDGAGQRSGLNRFLWTLHRDIHEIDEHLNATYFSHVKRTRIFDR